MSPCDKTSEDPAKHSGPFESVLAYEDDDGKTLSVERCKACGNTVVHEVPKEAA